MSNLDELREKVLDTLNRMPDESLNPFEEATDYILELFSHHLEQEKRYQTRIKHIRTTNSGLKIYGVRIVYDTEIIYSDIADSEDTARKKLEYELEKHKSQLTTNKSKEKHVHKFTTIDSFTPYQCECGLLEENYKK